ncbi:MAG: DMT family transporter [Clostridia bacterium]|nr:DMT family transporter [Clostridia bacterium]
MKTEQVKSSMMLMLTALIWGVAFVAQTIGMDYVGPFTFNSVRALIGGLVLMPIIPLLDKMKKQPKEQLQAELRAQRKQLIIGGIVCGTVLAVASSLQQIGLVYTTPSKAGFITALYIVIVPVLGIFMKKRPSALVWISVLVAAAGMYLLCIKDGFSIEFGDLMVLLCALAFSFHILVIDYFSPRVDGVRLSMIQFFVCAVVCAVPMFWAEKPTVDGIMGAWLPILYAGALSCGVAYTLQIVGQRNMNPTVASLILSLESVFSCLAGCLVLGDVLSKREIVGCVLVFAAILLAQIPMPGKRREER